MSEEGEGTVLRWGASTQDEQEGEQGEHSRMGMMSRMITIGDFQSTSTYLVR